ncbi:MAG TPA: protein kinase [Terriglobia bacterium]|nr:protein kinase [Terriglobia bacterium]
MAGSQDESAGVRAAEDLSGSVVGRFEIQTRLGTGGMGEVYRAVDTRLKRTVALKRVAPRLGSDPVYRERFLKEAERASALNHPHIADVYDFFEEKGELYLVMEYVEGHTLRERLQQPMSIQELLPVVRQCAAALGAAHEKGILHGDVKPENIMLTPSGGVKILDFGVAKRLPRRQEGAAKTESLPTAGGLSGTPAYMAPEVVLEKKADGRADLFSLGVVCYEALAGCHPFLADSFVGTTDRILHDEPPPLAKVNRSVSPEFERVVARMMAKEPGKRYANAAELLADLPLPRSTATGIRLPPDRRRGTVEDGRRRAWLGIDLFAGLALVVLAGIFVAAPALSARLQRWLTGSPSRTQALAVLPFEAIGGDADAQAFGQGLSETLSAKLSQLTATHSLEVVPSNEVRTQSVRTVEQARRALGVNLVLEGSLQRSGDLTRVTYSLVDAKTHRQLTADAITVEAANAFAVEDRVVDRVLAQLAIQLEPPEQRTLAQRGTSLPAAYDDYVRGRGYLEEDYHKIENVESAITEFRRALDLDPNYAATQAGLGMAYWYKFQITQNGDWVSQAKAACERAVTLSSSLADGHICLGNVAKGQGRYQDAVGKFRRAVELSPTSDDAYVGLASAFQGAGKLQDAENTYRQAIRLRPQHWLGYIWLGYFYYNQARYADAAEMFKRVVALAPDSFQGYSDLGGTYAAEGRYTEAIPLLEKSVAIYPSAYGYANLGTAYFYQRRFVDEVHAAEQAVKLAEGDYSMWGDLGDAYWFAPGKRGESAEAYRKAIELASERLQLNPHDATALASAALYHAMRSENAAALASITQALVLAPNDANVLLFAALADNQLGRSDAALRDLEKARAAGLSVSLVRDDPRFDNLRTEPRFQALIRKP